MTPPTDHSFATDDEIPWFSADGVGLELPSTARRTRRTDRGPRARATARVSW